MSEGASSEVGLKQEQVVTLDEDTIKNEDAPKSIRDLDKAQQEQYLNHILLPHISSILGCDALSYLSCSPVVHELIVARRRRLKVESKMRKWRRLLQRRINVDTRVMDIFHKACDITDEERKQAL
ncbi:hypothetical protein AKO1_007515 [Acrasis kona]|uniref:Uncharacterized protein n=1 Tax=Acrasis kona TaxID=1008807 RepID=A0AAW2YRX8_9EUKA